MKKKVAVISLMLLALSLSGCKTADENGKISYSSDCDGGLCMRWSYVQELPDGRSVVCAAANEALSCDWSNAK